MGNSGQFKKGHPGGPGRPKGSISLVGALKQHLEKHPQDLKRIVAATVADAIAGDVQARKLIFDRVDGGVRANLDITTAGEAIGKALIGVDIDRDI